MNDTNCNTNIEITPMCEMLTFNILHEQLCNLWTYQPINVVCDYLHVHVCFRLFEKMLMLNKIEKTTNYIMIMILYVFFGIIFCSY